MKSVEIITHCYAAKHDVYAKLLTAQISSLLIWPPEKCDVILTICGNREDRVSWEAFTKFGSWPAPNVGIRFWHLELNELFRRAIGRNKAMQHSEADVVWCADADYLFARDCLDTVAHADFGDYRAIIPAKAWLQRSHTEGDAEIAQIKIGEKFYPDLSCYKAWHPQMAIGGLFIVRGDWARKGYLDGSKWTVPIPDDKVNGFEDTWCDRKFRRLGLEHKVKTIDIPGVFRLRHSISAFETSKQRGVF